MSTKNVYMRLPDAPDVDSDDLLPPPRVFPVFDMKDQSIENSYQFTSDGEEKPTILFVVNFDLSNYILLDSDSEDENANPTIDEKLALALGGEGGELEQKEKEKAAVSVMRLLLFHNYVEVFEPLDESIYDVENSSTSSFESSLSSSRSSSFTLSSPPSIPSTPRTVPSSPSLSPRGGFCCGFIPSSFRSHRYSPPLTPRKFSPRPSLVTRKYREEMGEHAVGKMLEVANRKGALPTIPSDQEYVQGRFIEVVEQDEGYFGEPFLVSRKVPICDNTFSGSYLEDSADLQVSDGIILEEVDEFSLDGVIEDLEVW